jgi:hypothetical protein
MLSVFIVVGFELIWVALGEMDATSNFPSCGLGAI